MKTKVEGKFSGSTQGNKRFKTASICLGFFFHEFLWPLVVPTAVLAEVVGCTLTKFRVVFQSAYQKKEMF